MKNNLISVVLPLFNEEKNVPLIVSAVIKNIPKKYKYEIILVDDGSKDKTLAEVEKVTNKNNNVRGISFYRNFGHQAALLAGLSETRGDIVITMDADFQHPPELIPQFVSKYEEGHDLVAAQKQGDNDKLIISVFRKFGYEIFKLIGGNKILPGVSDFRLVTRQIVDYINECQESRTILRGLAMLPANNVALIPYKVQPRKYGVTGYGFYKLAKLFVYSVTSFSLTPLRLAGGAGLVMTFLSSLYLIYILFARYILKQQITQGWTALVFVVILLSGLQFIYLGIMGEYIGALFDEIKRRPRYIIKSKFNCKKSAV